MLPSLENRLATELNISQKQVSAAVRLLDEGATVPFIARYRKEVTDSLDDTQLRTLEDRLGYLRELDARRETVLEAIAGQDKLTDALRAAILAADTKQRLEDLYLPYKQKRRTKAQIAREAGLAPLAEALLNEPDLNPENVAQDFVDGERGVDDVKAALDGARLILVEQFSEDAGLLDTLRGIMQTDGRVVSQVVDTKAAEGEKFRDWFDFSEALKTIPSHRFLALLRGRNQGVLRLSIELPDTPPDGQLGRCEQRIAARFGIRDAGPPRRPMAARYGALGMVGEDRGASRTRTHEQHARARRGRSDQRVRTQHQGPAACRAGRPARHHRSRPGAAHGRESGGGRCHRQAPRHGHHLSACPAPRLGWRHCHAFPARRCARCRSHRHRQWHGLARDGKARR